MGKLKINLRRAINKCLHTEEHIYEIIKGSGSKTGTPKWKCKRCKKTIKSN